MARGEFPSAKQDQFNLRLPEGMRDELKRLATEDGRSMNAQIIEMLSEAIEYSGIDIPDLMGTVEAQLAEIQRLRRTKDVTFLEEENRKLRAKLDVWEPLMLQATAEEITMLSERLVRFRNAITDKKSSKSIEELVGVIERLNDEFPSLPSLAALIIGFRDE